MSETDAENLGEIPDNAVWYLAQSSWPFHRSVWRAVGRCLEYGEYTSLVRQIQKGEAEQLGDRGGLYRVALRDGTPIEIVVRTWRCKRTGPRARNYDLLRVWHPSRAEPKPSARTEKPPAPVPEPPPPPSIAFAPPLEPPAAPPPSPTPAPPPAPPPPVLRASTLTLGTKAASAAELLADRLRPAPLPPRADTPIVPKKKQTRR